jgi:hypothetical protein
MKSEFIKHKMENQKDLKTLSIIEEHYQGKPAYSNYQRATSHGSSIQKKLNPRIEEGYHRMLKKVKELFATLPNKEDRVIVELNLKAMPSDSFGLYSVLTSTFYFSMECDIYNNFRIEYLFHNCKFEKELRTWMIGYSINNHSFQNVRVDDYEDYFNRVLQVQPERFISLLDYKPN